MTQAMPETGTKGSTFNVVTMSEAFFRFTEDLPEISEAPWVQDGAIRIEGAASILKATSIAEIDSKLPEIVKQVPEGHRLVVIQYSGGNGFSIGRRYVLDLTKMPVLQSS